MVTCTEEIRRRDPGTGRPDVSGPARRARRLEGRRPPPRRRAARRRAPATLRNWIERDPGLAGDDHQGHAFGRRRSRTSTVHPAENRLSLHFNRFGASLGCGQPDQAKPVQATPRSWRCRNGTTTRVGGSVDGARGDAVIGTASGPPRPRAGILGWIAEGLTSDTSDRVRRVGAGGDTVAPPGGGMPPIELTPPSGTYLSFAEREDIAALRAKGMSMRDHAVHIGRSQSTTSRELRRNAATRNGKLTYRASTAEWQADLAAPRPKPASLAQHDRLREYVQNKLSGVFRAQDGTVVSGPDATWIGHNKPRRGDRRWVTAWSPEQISNRLPVGRCESLVRERGNSTPDSSPRR